MTSAEQRFEFRTAEVEHGLYRKLQSVDFILRGGVGLFASTNEIDRDWFRRFVEFIDLDSHTLGIQGIGFAKIIPEDEIPNFIEGMRNEGFTNFTLHPTGKRELYSSIVYLEPFDWRNQRAFGYDMLSDPVRREAMLHACDTGNTTMCGKITLAQETEENIQAGILMYRPVYGLGSPTGSVAERRAALQGFVYSPFQMNDFMRDMHESHPGIAIRIYDGASDRATGLLYDSALMSPS